MNMFTSSKSPTLIEIRNLAKVTKVIKIIESCNVIEQFEVAKNMLSFIDFETVGDNKRVYEILKIKEKQLNK